MQKNKFIITNKHIYIYIFNLLCNKINKFHQLQAQQIGGKLNLIMSNVEYDGVTTEMFMSEIQTSIFLTVWHYLLNLKDLSSTPAIFILDM